MEEVEISNEARMEVKMQTASQTGAAPQGVASAVKVAEGEVVRGEIIDLKQGQVSVRAESGEVITAKLMEPSDAAIGQSRAFTARLVDGRLTLTVNELPAEILNSKAVSDVLNSLGFKNTAENLKLAEIILNNQLPLTKETLMKLNQAMKLMGPENLDKALFLMENEMRVNGQNAELLKGFVNGETKIQGQLKELLGNLERLPKAEGNMLMEILLKGEGALGDGKLIEKLVEQIKVSGQEEMAQQKITAAFGNENLTMEGFGKLAEQLVKASPENAELITRLSDQKLAFMETAKAVTQNPELVTKLTEALQKGNLTPENFTRMVTEAGLELKDGVLARNELRYLLDLIPVKDEIKQGAREALGFTEQAVVKTGEGGEKLLSRLSFALNSAEPKELEGYLNGLRENLEIAKGEVAKWQLPEAGKILKDINGISQNLEFVSQIKSNVFLQIPLTVEGHNTNSELFVFKDKRRQGQNKKGGVSSAMIALDTANMGRFETYVRKDGSLVGCQFRLENENIQRLVRENLPKLEALLKDFNYTLDSVSFYTKGESFTLMDKEPVGETDTSPATGSASRIAFDVRM